MRPRHALPFAWLALAAACSHRQHQTLGTGRIVMAGAPDASAAIALPATSPGGDYRVRYQLWLPRAMEVRWTLRCGAYEEQGVAGETFAQYQVRRIAELQAAREQERQRRAQIGGLVGGALLGQVQGGATASTPTATAQATVTVDGAAVGAALGAATVADAALTLAPDDLGQGYRQGAARFWLDDAASDGGACTMEVAPVDPAADATAVGGTFAVERWFDARRAERQRVSRGVVSVRADLQAALVTGGADVTLQARRRAELEADMALRAEAAAEARVTFAGHVRGEVWQTREALYAYLGTCGGNRHYREELRAAEERRRLELAAAAELRVRIALDVRTRLRGGLIAGGADPALAARLRAEWAEEVRRRTAAAEAHAAAELAAYQAAQDEAARRAAMADGARGQLRDALVAMGARRRPPMPPPIDEYRGTAPSSDAAWRAGYWAWTGADWAWMTGRWIGGPPLVTVDVDVSLGGGDSGSATVATPAKTTEERPPVRDHRSAPAPTPPQAEPGRPRVRDHR